MVGCCFAESFPTATSDTLAPVAPREVVQFSDTAFRQISAWRTSPETKFG